MDLVVPPSPRLRRQPAGEGTAVVSTGRRGTTTVEEDSDA
jgi:NADH-quinone oxidoreductase subunit H